MLMYTVWIDDERSFRGYSDIKVTGIKDVVEDGVLTIWQDSNTASRFNWSRVRWYQRAPYATKEDLSDGDQEFNQQQENLANALENEG